MLVGVWFSTSRLLFSAFSLLGTCEEVKDEEVVRELEDRRLGLASVGAFYLRSGCN